MKSVYNFFYPVFFTTFLLACNTLPQKSALQKTGATSVDSIQVKYQLVTDEPQLPVELNVAPDNSRRKFITDNVGKIWILKKDSIISKPFLNIYDKLGKQAKNSPVGLIYSVAFHPRYSTNRKFFVCYNAPANKATNSAKLVISEFTASQSNPDIADLRSERRIFQMGGSNIQDNGAQIGFGPDGYLYISIGDNKGSDTTYNFHAQDLQYLNGKLLRIDVNKTPYSIPPDNPFVDVKNARPEIWAYGFRKLWHFSFDPATHQIFGGDVGDKKEEEIDIITRGSNYGWPVKEGDTTFVKSKSNLATGFTSPISTYKREVGICVIGGSFYYGNEIPLLKNKYVFADWNGSVFALSKNEHEKWIRQPLKIVNKPSDSFLICGCCVDANNDLFIVGYLVNKNGNRGAVYKIENI